MTDTIITQDLGDWVEITLNRPEKLNALTTEMGGGLLAALNTAQAERKRAILLTGAGRGFCTGQDLDDPALIGDGPPDLGESLRQTYNPIIAAIRAFDGPVICAVNGAAAGAGMSVALACDIVLAAEKAKFVLPFAKIGLVPGAGSSWTLPRSIGTARAKALALTAEPISAATAADWGVIWQAMPEDQLMNEARTLTARLAAGPTYGLAQSKHAINAATENSLTAQLDLEATLQTACGQSRDFAEGVAAFRQKRPAQFDGRGP